MKELTPRECAVMHCAFDLGRIYAHGGEKESPTEIEIKLNRSCILAAHANAIFYKIPKREGAE